MAGKIILYILCDNKINEAIINNKDYICGETLIKEINFLKHKPKSFNHIEFNNLKSYIEIKKLHNGSLSISALKPEIHCHLKVYESLVFINLSELPHPFDEFINPLEPYIKMHGLNDGKIAFQKDFVFNASHLATIHNFKECAHCWGGEFTHKDYLSVVRIYFASLSRE